MTQIGARYSEDNGTSFTVWAPLMEAVGLKTELDVYPMEKDRLGYWRTTCSAVRAGDSYTYLLDDALERPDPASYCQPYGVHGPSVVIDHRYPWTDADWRGLDLESMIIYELHVGTFTVQGTFAAVIDRLDELRRIGINAIEVMPVAQFPGSRSWGYDGVYPFAVQSSYGGPEGLKALVDACHCRSIAVILDVVYNHLGPEGNYLQDFGPYFTDRYRTPWGMALNFDGPYSNEVRNFFCTNALYWLAEYHVDALRLDAIHGIFDQNAKPFLQCLSEEIEQLGGETGRKMHAIAESDLNDCRVVAPPGLGGHGMKAQWSDDFHHALHSVLTGERQGYYADFGTVGALVRAVQDGYVYQGQYSAFRKRNHGNSAQAIEGARLICFCQNHDQVGNRMLGERLAALVPFEALKVAAGILLASPYIPLLFMGEEYGEASPFLYFVDHSDLSLIRAVREGRKAEFRAFHWQGEPPEPDRIATFMASRIDWQKRYTEKGSALLGYFARLIKLRNRIEALSRLSKRNMKVYGSEDDRIMLAHRWDGADAVFWLANLDGSEKQVNLPLPSGRWTNVLDSDDREWGGAGRLLPDTVDGGSRPLSIRGYGFAMFEMVA